MLKVVIIIFILAFVAAAVTMLVMGSTESRHRDWIPGSRPMATPPKGKRWAYDLIKEEWYLEDV